MARLFLLAVLLCLLHSSTFTAQAPTASDQPRFSGDNELARPENYREWIYLSSGIGMSYSATANSSARARSRNSNDTVFPVTSIRNAGG